jgi:8-oxo-dGTP diphosphatase
MTDLTDDRPAISAGIITQDGAVLLVQRKVKEGSLSWQFPAGEVEPGETLEEAAARETVEETGLTVSPVQLLGERIHPKTGRRMA